MKNNILIAGMPRTGKTTLLKTIISPYHRRVGFITNEVRENGERVGFEIEAHTGRRAMLASTHFTSGPQVSRYHVNVENLDGILPEVDRFSSKDLLYLDEIGQMELYSEQFKRLVLRYLAHLTPSLEPSRKSTMTRSHKR